MKKLDAVAIPLVSISAELCFKLPQGAKVVFVKFFHNSYDDNNIIYIYFEYEEQMNPKAKKEEKERRFKIIDTSEVTKGIDISGYGYVCSFIRKVTAADLPNNEKHYLVYEKKNL